MLEYAGTLLNIDHFEDKFSWGFPLISHVHLKSYSLKNIAISSKSSYQIKPFDKIESVIKRMKWQVQFFMSGSVIEYDKEPFGLKSKNCPVQIKELEGFEKDLLGIVKSIKFRSINNKSRNLMKADIAKDISCY